MDLTVTPLPVAIHLTHIKSRIVKISARVNFGNCDIATKAFCSDIQIAAMH